MSFNPERLKVMKKFYIALAVFATAALTSCVQEQSFDNHAPLAKDAIAFHLRGTTTKSAEVSPAAVKGVTLSLGKMDNGESLFLEETIEELNPTLATKGAPAYTENVGTLYKDNLGVHTSYSDFIDATFERESTEVENGGWTFFHRYTNVPWPSGNVDFYLRMPVAGTGVSSLSHNETDKTISFTFESPATAAAQQDLLLGYTSLTEEQHESYRDQGGAPVLMYHALTAVKFRQGWANENGTKTIITGVKWNGIKSKGTCTFSGESGVVDWNLATGATKSFTQDFNDADWSNDPGVDGTVDYNSGDNKFGESWYAAGTDTERPSNTNNLNNADGEWTFWFIPQEMDENVTLEVSFKVKVNATQAERAKELTYTLNFGEQLNGIEWKAGQLRTYTLKPHYVGVELTDVMDPTKLIKSDVTITNTGNVCEYVRANIIGNWVGKIWAGVDGEGHDIYSETETVLNGFTDNTGALMTPLWNDKDGLAQTQVQGYAAYPEGGYGTFSPELPAKATLSGGHYSPENEKHWIRIDKYYYHTTPIGPGESIEPEAILFDYYSVKKSPVFWVRDASGVLHKASNVHLELDILVQVILAPEDETSSTGYVPYDQAWCDALGVTMEKLGDL